MINKRYWYIPYFFLAPAILGLLVFKFYPIMNSLVESFYKTSFVSQSKIFVGLNNYLSILKDPVFQNSMLRTIFFNIIINPLQISLAFMLALLLMKNIRTKYFFRTIHIIPITVSFPIACILWGIVLNPDQGLVNSILAIFGIPNQPFLYSGSQAFWSIIGIATWKGVGYWTLFLIAGLEEIPHSLYEASWIDGANRLEVLKSVTLPLMKRPLLFVIVADTVSNFLLFAPQYLLTKGGPDGSTDFIMFEIFKNAFGYSNIGAASAMVVILLLLILVIIGLENQLLKEN